MSAPGPRSSTPTCKSSMSVRKSSSLVGGEPAPRVMRFSRRREDLAAGLFRIYCTGLSGPPVGTPAPLGDSRDWPYWSTWVLQMQAAWAFPPPTELRAGMRIAGAKIGAGITVREVRGMLLRGKSYTAILPRGRECGAGAANLKLSLRSLCLLRGLCGNSEVFSAVDPGLFSAFSASLR